MIGAPHTTAQTVVKQLDLLRRSEGLSRNELARRAGVAEHTLRDWWSGSVPNIANLEAVLGALGCGLKIVPRRKEIAPLRSGPLLFVVAGVLRDNGVRKWSAKEIAAVMADRQVSVKDVSNTLLTLRRQKRAGFDGKKHFALKEDARCATDAPV